MVSDEILARPVQATRQHRFMRAAVPYLWLLPAMVTYTIFKLVPLFSSFYLALIDWNGLDPAKYVGLRNFERMLEDSDILIALLHNVQYAIGTVIGKIVLSLFLAVLLNQALRGRSFYRTALFLPVIMSFVVISVLWTWMYDSEVGMVNAMLSLIGLGWLKQDWLGNPNIAMISLIIVDIWKWYGFHMVIFLAGLQTIPEDLYEAAMVDGASRIVQFWRITLPLLKPVMLINVTLSLMGAFNVFDIPFIMTEGGPAKATLVAALHIYIRGFKFYKFGYASALSIVLLALVSIMAAVQMKLMSSDETKS